MMRNKMTPAQVGALRALLPGCVLAGDEVGEDWAHDELSGTRHMPEAVVHARSTQDVSTLMAWCQEQEIALTPRGMGTGLVGACVPVAGGVVLDMTGMNRILALDEDNLSVTVQPGVLLMELAAYVEERGLFYPPDPGEKSATIGGNISTNAGGMRAVKYGVTRDYVRALEVVLPGGHVLTLGSETVKNASGLSLKDLVVGSEGTLCVITKATLKLLPLPARTVSLLVPYPTLKQAIETVPDIIRSKAAPQSVEFMEQGVILDAETYLGKRFPDHSAPAYLLLRFDGATLAAIEADYDAVAQLCLRHGALDVLISDTAERDESIWAARGAFLEAIKAGTTLMDEVDCVVPRSRIHEMVSFLHALQGEAGLRIKSFGHAGDGNLHTYLLRDTLPEAEWAQRMADTMQKIYQKAKELGGLVSGEHGIGYAKRAYLRESLDPQALLLMQGIKRVFDPKGILNPHKVYAQ